MSHSICAFVVLQTDDDRLTSPRREQTTMREAVADALPSIAHVVAVMSEAEAALMVTAHLRAMEMVMRRTGMESVH
jgi:hypothetical protein